MAERSPHSYVVDGGRRKATKLEAVEVDVRVVTALRAGLSGHDVDPLA